MLKFNEVLLSGTPETGVVLDLDSDYCEARIDGQFVCCQRLAAVCEAALRERGIRLEAQPAMQEAPLPQEPQTVTERTRGRCPFYKAIRRCYAIFQEHGLPTDDEGMRIELSRLMRRTVGSRHDLQAQDWLLAGDRAKCVGMPG